MNYFKKIGRGLTALALVPLSNLEIKERNRRLDERLRRLEQRREKNTINRSENITGKRV
jgi:hypothetical protein